MQPLLVGLALGSAAMYFFDPDRGQRRRALLRDRTVGATNSARDFVDDGVRDLKNRGSAATSRVKSMFSSHAAEDRALVEHVRAVMGHHVGHPGAIDVSPVGGRVTLNGPILSHERSDLIDAVRAIPGVTEVVDQLAVYETAKGIWELQGTRSPPRRSVANPRDWPPGAQLVAGAAVGLFFLRHSRRLRYAVYLAATGASLMRLAPGEEVERLTHGTAHEAGTRHEADAARTPLEEIA